MGNVVLRHLAWRRAAWIAVAVLLAALLVAAGVWRGTGGRWLTIETASMGEAAPVGTLVLTRPTTPDRLHPGDIVSFHSPTGATYTHRVVQVQDGVVRTQGDDNGTVDPYRTTGDQLVGKVVARWWAMGFVVRAMPWLLGLGALGWLVTRRIRMPIRTAVRVFGASLLVAGVILVQRPLVGVQVASARHTHGATEADVVSTGLLPISVQAAGGDQVHLVAGELGTVTGGELDAYARLPLQASPHLTGWWLVAVVSCCAAPVLAALWLGRRHRTIEGVVV